MRPRRCQLEEVVVRQVHGRSSVNVYAAEVVKGHAGSDVINGKLVLLQTVVGSTRGSYLNQLQADKGVAGTNLPSSRQI